MNWNIIAQNLSIKGTDNIFVDLGAQIGAYSEFFWNNYSTYFTKLISVEPVPENCRKIQERIVRCNAQKKWIIDECAISTSDGEQDFSYFRNELGPLGSFVYEDVYRHKEYPPLREAYWDEKLGQMEKIRVKLKTMHNICENPTVIKIDIEGFEYPIIPELLRISSVYALIIEFHQLPYPASEKNGYLLEDYLTWIFDKGFVNMTGETDSENGEFYFLPSVPNTLRWNDLPSYPYDRCFHVLAQKSFKIMKMTS